jgi:hypothetical protein|tara:strand:+ start:78 stop:224 length:147 start_codon:yes stop_codon:yes gene_type:complete
MPEFWPGVPESSGINGLESFTINLITSFQMRIVCDLFWLLVQADYTEK